MKENEIAFLVDKAQYDRFKLFTKPDSSKKFTQKDLTESINKSKLVHEKVESERCLYHPRPQSKF